MVSAGSAAQLANAWEITRLSLHVLGATEWIGGQFVVAGLLPTVREFGNDAPGKIARAFARLSWPAFALLLATGIWNVVADVSGHPHPVSPWDAILNIKIVLVVIAGLGTYLHTRVSSPKQKGIYAGVGLLASLGAMVLGIALAG